MGGKLWTWANSNRLLAIIIVLLLVIAVSSAADGISSRRTAREYLNSAKGWADAYKRDTAASKKVYESKIESLTKQRDSEIRLFHAALDRMGTPWVPPKGNKELIERFRALGYEAKTR